MNALTKLVFSSSIVESSLKKVLLLDIPCHNMDNEPQERMRPCREWAFEDQAIQLGSNWSTFWENENLRPKYWGSEF